MPAIIGGSPRSVNRASERHASTVSRSPWTTWMSKPVWLSAYVVNVCVAPVGIVVLRWISFSTTPPIISTPSDSGTTSSRTACCCPPASTSACTAAPSAHDLVRIEVAQRLAAEHAGDVVAHDGRAGRAADEDHAVEPVRRTRRRPSARAAARLAGALEQRPRPPASSTRVTARSIGAPPVAFGAEPERGGRCVGQRLLHAARLGDRGRDQAPARSVGVALESPGAPAAPAPAPAPAPAASPSPPHRTAIA